MVRIDIRDDDEDLIDQIQFATEARGNAHPEDERTDIAYFLNTSPSLHPNLIFIEADTGDYLAVRKHDIKNLIKALERALVIWPNV